MKWKQIILIICTFILLLGISYAAPSYATYRINYDRIIPDDTATYSLTTTSTECNGGNTSWWSKSELDMNQTFIWDFNVNQTIQSEALGKNYNLNNTYTTNLYSFYQNNLYSGIYCVGGGGWTIYPQYFPLTNLTNTDFTLSCGVFLNTTGERNTTNFGIIAVQYVYAIQVSNGRFQYGVRNATATASQTGNTIAYNNSYYLLTLTFNNTNRDTRFYVNGSLDNNYTASVTVGAINNASPLKIFSGGVGYGGTGIAFNGTGDFCIVSRRVFSPQEISELYNSTIQKRAPKVYPNQISAGDTITYKSVCSNTTAYSPIYTTEEHVQATYTSPTINTQQVQSNRPLFDTQSTLTYSHTCTNCTKGNTTWWYSNALSPPIAIFDFNINNTNVPNHANYSNNLSCTVCPTYNSSGYFLFDGVNDNFEYTSKITTSFTIRFVTTLFEQTSYQYFIANRNSSDGVYFLQDLTGGYILMVIRNNSVSNIINKSVTKNVQYDIAGTYNGSSMNLYFDGKLIVTAPYSGTLPDINTIYIGKNYDNTYQLNGSIDNILIYNRALSAQEISELYNSTKDNYAPHVYPEEVSVGDNITYKSVVSDGYTYSAIKDINVTIINCYNSYTTTQTGWSNSSSCLINNSYGRWRQNYTTDNNICGNYSDYYVNESDSIQCDYSYSELTSIQEEYQMIGEIILVILAYAFVYLIIRRANTVIGDMLFVIISIGILLTTVSNKEFIMAIMTVSSLILTVWDGYHKLTAKSYERSY